ncbi:GNAT family N-acetyltransferase [Legionella sp. D16C41]|uniref:GNAT family N-acetyltransferase n=1 Tax=Legionella sp. D16C41 TaxID=3402688 RepID=UPI003AF9F045
MDIEELKAKLKIKQATLADYPTIQNMARFYVYDLSRECGFISVDWACPADGLYESFNFKNYFTDPTRKAFLILIGDELAGFALLNQVGIYPDTMWNMGEFFILAKFQGKGVGCLSAFQLWQMHPGLWEVSVIPENYRGLAFWRKTIAKFTNEDYQEKVTSVDYDFQQPKRVIFRFTTNAHQQSQPLVNNEKYAISIIDKIDEATESHMTRDLIAYETSHGIDVNYRRFSVIIINERKEIFGVLNAYTAFAEIYIDDIWIDHSYRGKGYGKQLLLALENNFKGKGFNNINLVTSAFQAPEFYLKCGFEREFIRINKKNPKLSKSFFVKFFNEESETQGLLK